MTQQILWFSQKFALIKQSWEIGRLPLFVRFYKISVKKCPISWFLKIGLKKPLFSWNFNHTLDLKYPPEEWPLGSGSGEVKLGESSKQSQSTEANLQ